jgi:hypothetical protein
MPDDARLLELTWLAQLEQATARTFGGYPTDGAERRLLLHLLAEGYATDHQAETVIGTRSANADVIRRHAKQARWSATSTVLQGRPVTLTITHAGACRRAELEQKLKNGRARDPSGLLWDGHHLRQDARIALLDVSPARPLAVVMIDLDDRGVAPPRARAGEDVVRRYLERVADAAADRGDAYRLSAGAGGVVVLWPRTTLEAAVDDTRGLLAACARELADQPLRPVAGVVVGFDVAEPVDALRARAAAEHQRARALARTLADAPAVVAWPPDRHATT